MNEVIEFRQTTRVTPCALLQSVADQTRELRRHRTDLMVPAEAAIQNARVAVEEMGSDSRLSEVEVLLKDAQEKVSEYVDSLLKVAR